jgi:hypothetical protein
VNFPVKSNSFPAKAIKCNPVLCNSPHPKQYPKCEGICEPIAGAFGWRDGITASAGGVVDAIRAIGKAYPLSHA